MRGSAWKRSFAPFGSKWDRGSGPARISMTAAEFPSSFVDTNVLVYAITADDTRRSPIAQKLLQDLMDARALRTSTQVLQESFATLTRKGRTPLTAEQAL